MNKNEKTGCSYSRDVTVLPSMCGTGSRMSIPAVFDMFQDTATCHADLLDIGPDGMERRNCFWIISKIRLRIFRLPKMMERAVSSTWVQAADRVSCERDYSITSGDEVLAYGRSVWAVISRETGKLVHLNELYPDVAFDKAPPDDMPWRRIGKKFEGAEKSGEYTVRSVDIDLSGHMNNVNYIKAMLGCFSSDEISSMGISEVEVNYITQTYEGETLTFVRRDASDGSGIEIGALNSEGKTVFLAFMR